MKKVDLSHQIVSLIRKLLSTVMFEIYDFIGIIKLPGANQEITFKLTVVELVNTKLEKGMTGLQKNQTKFKQCSRKVIEDCHRLFYDIVELEIKGHLLHL